MDPRTRRNLQEFKKQIKKSVIQNKKKQVRKALPYYKDMFLEDDEFSNGTNSRSSRFPVRACSSKEKIEILGQRKVHSAQFKQNTRNNYKDDEREQQKRFLEYLRNFNCTFTQEDKCIIENNMVIRFGQKCFHDLNQLRDRVYRDLLNYQNTLCEKQNLSQMTTQEWDFIIASFKIAQNQKFEQISRSSFTLLSIYFNEWHMNKLYELIHKGKQIELFLEDLTIIQKTEIQVQEIILSKLIQDSEIKVDGQSISIISGYFLKKIECFECLEREMLKIYTIEESQTFSEMIFNFGFIFAMQTLTDIATRTQTDSSIKMGIYTLVSKYFSEYPINVVSETQTFQKFRNFIQNYIGQLIQFTSGYKRVIYGHKINQNDYKFLQSTLILLQSLLWRNLNDQLLGSIVEAYDLLIEICMGTDGTITNLPWFQQLHIKMLQFSLLVFSLLEGGQSWFQTKNYFQYVSLLTLYWLQVKFAKRNSIYDQKMKNITVLQSMFQLQFYLIYALFITKFMVDKIDDIRKQRQISEMLEYAEIEYRKQRDMLQKFDSQTLQSINFVFESNVKLYFDLFCRIDKKQIQNPENNFYVGSNEEIQI